MARVELPTSRLRARRRRRRSRLVLACCAGVVLLFGIVAGLSHLPFLQVRVVEVSGTATLATSTLESYIKNEIAGQFAYVFPKKNIFLYPKQAIALGLLAEFPELQAADVHAQNFHTIAAEVAEREQKALWCQDEHCYLMDQSGAVYVPAPAGTEGLVAYHGKATGERLPRQYLSAKGFESLFALVDALSQKPSLGIVESVYVDAQGDAQAVFASGFELKFALSDAGGDVFERFSLALGADPFLGRSLAAFEYLDLRFGDKLYYKLK
ncbi:MAG TPA: hypothetical protein VJJ20_00270 [Candidatus Paceibacterota bacterium]